VGDVLRKYCAYSIVLHSTHNTVCYEATYTCTYNNPGCVLLETNRKVKKGKARKQTILTPKCKTI